MGKMNENVWNGSKKDNSGVQFAMRLSQFRTVGSAFHIGAVDCELGKRLRFESSIVFLN